LRSQPQPSIPEVLAWTITPGPIPPLPIETGAPPLPPNIDVKEPASPNVSRVNGTAKSNVVKTASVNDQNDVLFPEIAYSEIENKDTADHIAQAENLLRSIRSIHLGDDDNEIDVTYEKAMSRRLLDQNVVLRRDAETSGKFPVKSLLGDLEPFLVDIANLPDKTTPTELRAIKDRVQKTEIVAALQSY
ncbi:MAG TPA: hypothetical protein VNF70_05650, partial [Pyrinomonadaceae bacterium]|nr:hypothetical protein [Pyrinomonadaceae bacterium]